MACGCGGACCGQQGGLGFLWWGGGESADDELYGDYDYLYDYGGNYGGGDYWGFNDSFWGGGSNDFWGFDDPFWGDPNVYDVGLVDQQESEKGGEPLSNAWQQLLDWWANLTTGGYTPNVPLPGPEPNTSTLPPFSGYCPPNTYCADFPNCTQCLPIDNSRAAKAAAAAHKAAQAAAKAAAQQRAKQQQRCPPNTGLVKNAQGQCVCPPGYAPNAQLKKCVLVNASLAAQSNQAPDWLKYALLALGAVVVVKAVKK